MARIEHVNLTVRDPQRTAAMLEALFGWQVRWEGPNGGGGRTIHVGSGDSYLALCTVVGASAGADNFVKGRPLNHVGVEVDDLGDVEARVVAAELTPFSHGDYEPGRRFYFLDADGVEFEVVSYMKA